MNKTTLLKIYLMITAVSVALFLTGFAIGWHTAENMAELLTVTLPFLLMALASLIAFGFTPDIKQVCRCTYSATNVVPFKIKSYSDSYTKLRKIS